MLFEDGKLHDRRGNVLKTLIYFPPEYRDLAHKIRENYIEHHHGEVDLVSETYQIGIEYAGEIRDRKRDRIGLFMGKPYADTDR